jgi:hypothetical protein
VTPAPAQILPPRFAQQFGGFLITPGPRRTPTAWALRCSSRFSQEFADQAPAHPLSSVVHRPFLPADPLRVAIEGKSPRSRFKYLKQGLAEREGRHLGGVLNVESVRRVFLIAVARFACTMPAGKIPVRLRSEGVREEVRYEGMGFA